MEGAESIRDTCTFSVTHRPTSATVQDKGLIPRRSIESLRRAFSLCGDGCRWHGRVVGLERARRGGVLDGGTSHHTVALAEEREGLCVAGYDRLGGVGHGRRILC